MYTANKDRKYKTAHLTTVEEKWQCLKNLFKDAQLKGDLLLPDEDLYGLPLDDMLTKMLDWLDIKTDKKIWVGFSDKIEPAGLYFEEDGTHFILVNQKHQKNRYEAAAVLAHELMHFCLMGEFNFRLEETLDNEQLTDMATIYSGLGLVVLNGFEYSSGWLMTAVGLMFGWIMIGTHSMSFGYYKPKQYAKMFTKFVDTRGLPYGDFSGYLLPWTRHFVPSKLKMSAITNRHKSKVAKQGQKAVNKQTALSILTILVLIPVAVWVANLGGGKNSHIPEDVQKELTSQKANIDTLDGQYQSCSSRLYSQETTLDTTNQSAVDAYNSEVDQCEGVRSEHNSAVDKYNDLLSKYK